MKSDSQSRYRHDKKTNEDRVIVEDYSDDRLAIVIACVYLLSITPEEQN